MGTSYEGDRGRLNAFRGGRAAKVLIPLELFFAFLTSGEA